MGARDGAERDGRVSRRAFLRRAGALSAALVAGLGGKPARAAAKRPNIVLFLADDLGWMDSTVYGSRYYDTPNMERLAKRSVRFTDAYAANPLCSPTRASIMTGKYPARLRITTPGGHLPARPNLALLPESAPPHEPMLLPNSKRFLPLEEYTLGEALRDVGYRTGFVGKWHLGHDEKYWPGAQGFEVNVAGGRWPGPPSYHAPYRISTLEDGPDGEYLTDRLGAEAVRFIERDDDRPFFLCMWHYAVHAPYQDKEDLTDRYRDRRDPLGRQNNPVMASMIRSLDDALGRMLDTLDERGLAEDTIILFFSDNGGNEYDRVGDEQLTPTNNDPLRSGKGSIYEGGVRVPMMVCWPGVAKPGSVSGELVSSIDLYPTVLDMAGAAPQPGQVIDGENLAPVLKGHGALGRDAVFCHMPHHINAPTGPLNAPCTSVRKGKWKLIRFYVTTEAFPNAYELYNLKNDIGETRNLADAKPKKVAELDALIDRFLEETDALVPQPNPAYDPEARREVDGWHPSGQCALKEADRALRVTSLGGDPFLWNNTAIPEAEGDITAAFRMRSEAGGGGQFFWGTRNRPRFGPKQRLDFAPVHDGAWREYTVPFVADSLLTAVRIDPATAPGTIDIQWIRLIRDDGTVLTEWQFGK